MPAIACMQIGDQNDCDLFKKRAILFMGISILPLLRLRGEADAAGELGFPSFSFLEMLYVCLHGL